MGDENTDLRIDVAVIKSKLDAIEKSMAGRATREWAIIMTGIGLVATIIIKSIGF